jgi:cytochrome c553
LTEIGEYRILIRCFNRGGNGLLAKPFCSLALLSILSVLSYATLAQAEEFPGWAFPLPQPMPPAVKWDDTKELTVPGSEVHFTEAQLHKPSRPPDWYPAEHSSAPSIVGGRDPEQGWACGYCHLPNGSGRPENAKLAGLPADYILSQVGAFRRQDRHPDVSNWRPTRLMGEAVSNVSQEDIVSAAHYFSRQTVTSFVRVIESKTVPQHAAGFGIMMPLPGKPVPIGSRIVELPDDIERFEHRDPKATYTAYVPKGSIERGRQLATKGGPNRPAPCVGCHGAGLRGDVNLPAPPIAGRFPTYLFRQLYAFRSGSRSGDATLPMQAVAAQLTQADMIALASYVASLKP